MSNETKVRLCWDCDFFQQAGEQDNSGKCMRHAPTKAAQLKGDTVTSCIDGLEMFPNIIDGTQTSCGEFKYSTVTIPTPPA